MGLKTLCWIVFCLLPIAAVAAPDTIETVTTRAHKEIAERDAVIQQLKTQIDVQAKTIQALISSAADKDALIAKLQHPIIAAVSVPVVSAVPSPITPQVSLTPSLPSFSATPAQLTDRLAEKAEFTPIRNPVFPPDPTGKRLVEEITFTGGTLEGSPLFLAFNPIGNPNRVVRRPVLPDSTGEDFAIVLADICKELGVPANRVGSTVYMLDGVVGGGACAGLSGKMFNP